MALPSPDRQSIRDAIAREESRLLRLEAGISEAQARLTTLKTALAARGEPIETSHHIRSIADQSRQPQDNRAGRVFRKDRWLPGGDRCFILTLIGFSA
jgi:hypothetical protein